MNEIICSVCLIPTKSDQKYLDQIISSLAKKYRAYIFIPHLTVYGVLRGPKEEIGKAVDYAFKAISKFSIKADKLDHSEVFSKTLFIQFEMNNALLEIYNKLRLKLKKYLIDCKEYDLNPHISLIYKHGIPNKEKEEIIRSTKMKNEFVFDRCSIISATKPIEKEEDVKDFEITADTYF